MEVTGKLKVIGNTQAVSEKFKKRDFVLTDDSSQYPQHILFQLTQDRCGLLDRCKVGDTIKVHFNLRGREWISPDGEAKYFNSLEAWRIESGVEQTDKDGSTSVAQFQQADDLDPLPF